MKNQILILTVFILTSSVALAQKSNDTDLIIKTVNQFSKGADEQNVEMLESVLDAQFRAALNRAFGSKELTVVDKTTYLQMAKDKKIGGDKRIVTIKSIDLQSNIAQVQAIFEGSKFAFTTFISLIKNEKGDWVIIQDMPEIVSK